MWTNPLIKPLKCIPEKKNVTGKHLKICILWSFIFFSLTVSCSFKWFLWSSSPDETVRAFLCGGSGGCDPSCCGDVPGAAGRAQCQLGRLHSSSKALKRPRHSSIQTTAQQHISKLFQHKHNSFCTDLFYHCTVYKYWQCLPAELCQK